MDLEIAPHARGERGSWAQAQLIPEQGAVAGELATRLGGVALGQEDVDQRGMSRLAQRLGGDRGVRGLDRLEPTPERAQPAGQRLQGVNLELANPFPLEATESRPTRDVAAEVDPTVLDTTYDAVAATDMTGNADAHLIALNPSRTLAENLCAYYAGPTAAWRTRWQRFAAAIGLGAFTPAPTAMPPYWRALVIGTFSGSTERWRTDMQHEVMQAAVAFAAANGRGNDVVAVLSNPDTGLLAPTIWELYRNVSGWVLDEFLRRLKRSVAGETP
jgi:hypothetical protein